MGSVLSRVNAFGEAMLDAEIGAHEIEVMLALCFTVASVVVGVVIAAYEAVKMMVVRGLEVYADADAPAPAPAPMPAPVPAPMPAPVPMPAPAPAPVPEKRRAPADLAPVSPPLAEPVLARRRRRMNTRGRDAIREAMRTPLPE